MRLIPVSREHLRTKDETMDWTHLSLQGAIRYFPSYISINTRVIKKMYRNDKVMLLPFVFKCYSVNLDWGYRT